MTAQDDLVDHLLAVARQRLGMELAWLSSFVDGEQIFDRLAGPAEAFGLECGDASPLSDSYCVRVLDQRLPNIIRDTAANPVAAALPVTDEIGIGAYIGVPIRQSNGTPRGMLCCINSIEADLLDDDDLHTMELLAELLSDIVNLEGSASQRQRAIADRVANTIDKRDFHIMYQPIIDIASGRTVGVEALSRFQGGPSRPNLWFAEAASVGLGVELELAAIEVALSGLHDLDSSHYLALNVSPEAASDPRLLELLSTSEPERIVLELTEHTAIVSYSELCDALDKLRSHGLRIAVDDAGAGFSSLSHVLEIRPSLLKIDRSIVNGLQLDQARMSLVQAIIDIADRVDATVIAEGVESRTDLDCLGAMGITHAQGYFLGRPATLPPALEAPQAAVATRTKSADTAGAKDLNVRRFELAITHSPIGMALVSPNGAFLHANPAFAEILGHDVAAISSVTVADFMPARNEVALAKVASDFLSGSRTSFRAERKFRRPDGQLRWGDLSFVLVRSNGQPTYFLVQLQDITERRIRETHLAQLAGTDYLTSVANRAAGRDRLDRLAKTKAQLAVMYCDLRSFKQVNDQYGHQAGDHVLQTIAQRLCRQVRAHDIVSRWGGDEFLIIMQDASPDLLEGVRERIVAAVAQPIPLPGRVDTVLPEITVGIATNDGQFGLPIDDLLHWADSDMYRQRPDTALPTPQAPNQTLQPRGSVSAGAVSDAMMVS